MRAKTATKHVAATQSQLAGVERAFTRMYRWDALGEQKMRCIYCRDRITRDNATADHLVPRSRGGTTAKKNIRAACKPCNEAKGNGNPTWFRDRLHAPIIPLGDTSLTCAWIRFRLNRRVEKAERRICRAVGMVMS